jgi:SAM-dependent MidA family methyltransferase
LEVGAPVHSPSEFRWARLPPEPERWNAALADAGLDMPPDLLAVLPDGFTLELCPEAAAWWNAAAQRLRAGKLLTLDYGLTAEELLRPERSQGTLRAYYRHRLSEDVLAHPGEQDLTAHLQFTHLQKAGELAGLHTEGLASQGQWLTRIAERAWRLDSGFGPWTPAQTRQFRTLTFPEHLGRAFRVFIQTR